MYQFDTLELWLTQTIPSDITYFQATYDKNVKLVDVETVFFFLCVLKLYSHCWN